MTLGELAQIVATWRGSGRTSVPTTRRSTSGGSGSATTSSRTAHCGENHGADAFPPGPGGLPRTLHISGPRPSPSEAFDEALRAWSWNTYVAGRLSHNHRRRASSRRMSTRRQQAARVYLSLS